VLDVLESDPAFTCFTLDGQAIVLEDYLDARPENETRLRALLDAGRLEVGPSYILPDELLVGAEALVRNLLIGRAVCERFGGRPAPIGYMPDSFGHPLQLPQILVGFGIDSFIFSRGMGDQLDEVGVVFRWRARDGSEVRAFQQLSSYSNFNVPDADGAVARINEIADRFGAALARAGVDAVLLCDGEDHRRIRRNLPGLCVELADRRPGSSFTIARYTDYVAAVKPEAGELPAYAGELLGSRLQNVLRGVNSARLYLKRANERAERRLLEAETLTALRTLHTGEPFPTSDFRLAWVQLLKNHPHDSICGCSCDEVHRDMLVRYEQLDRTISTLQRAAAGAGTSVVNLLPYRRLGLVEVPGCEPAVIGLDGFSARAIDLNPATTPEPRDGTSIESDTFRVEAARHGTLTLTDKRTGRTFEGLHRLEDEPDLGDLYNFCPADGAAPSSPASATARVLRAGPVIHELEIRTPSVTTVVRLIEGIDRVEFRTSIDNDTTDHRLRAIFPVGDTKATDVRAEGQFALVHRPLNPPAPITEWVEPPDPTQHTLGAVALGPLALLTKGLPEYEARSTEAGPELCLTLLRCVGVISKPTGALSTRPLGAGPQTPTPEGQCRGCQECEYALVRGADALDETELLRASQDYRHAFLITDPPADFDSPLSVDGHTVFSCLKGAEDGDGLILRVFNAQDAPARIEIAGEVSVTRARLDESPDERGDVLQPYEIATFRLRPCNKREIPPAPRLMSAG
jgi:alpha-mannosidase